MAKYFAGTPMTDIEPVEVSIYVPATPEEVFTYWISPARYVKWMGSEATLEPRAGGVFHVHMSDGMANSGIFLEVEPSRLVRFTWGFADAEAAKHTLHDRGDVKREGEVGGGSAMPAGSTRVTVMLAAEAGGTRLTLRHDDLPNAELREAHHVAWNTYLPRLAIRAAGGDPGPDPHA
jgi:uncharacterized protein YndB with AHSA1/START domain